MVSYNLWNNYIVHKKNIDTNYYYYFYCIINKSYKFIPSFLVLETITRH